MLQRSYFWHQAQVCLSLARVTTDPAQKQHYQALALDFARNAGTKRDLDMTASPLATVKPKPDSGNTNPHK